MQDFSAEQSGLMRHSGRHDGGVPTYVGRQEHDGCLFTFWHCAFGPHGEGLQGSSWPLGSGGTETSIQFLHLPIVRYLTS
jgi:hypothetical protein